MNTTYTLTEGNNALNRVLLMMQYELGKTLDEQKIPTDKDLKKFQRDDYENNTRKYVDNTSVSYKDENGRQKTTATFPKNTVKIEALTLSEGILKLRDFFYSKTGAITQVVLSIVGVEIGMPLVFELLDGAIIVNDAYIMVRDWNPNGPKISVTSGPMGNIQTDNLWEWFKFHFTTNEGFQYLCVDILAVLAGLGLMSLGKSVVKSAKGVFKILIESLGPNFALKIVEFLEKFKPNTSGLPKQVVSWVDKKMVDINKAIDIWKTPGAVVKSVTDPKKVAGAVVGGYLTSKLMDWVESKKEKIIKFFESNPNAKNVTINCNVTNPTDNEMLEAIFNDNPDLFKKKPKIDSFKMILDKSKMPIYVIIENVKYKIEYKGPKIGYKLTK